MKENINNLQRRREVRKALVDKNVSANSIEALERALKNGLVLRRAADLAILNLAAADVGILEDAVDFGEPAPEANVQTLEFAFVPDGNAGDFVGHQFFITYINRDTFSVSESYPIEDSRIVYVDVDLNGIAPGTKVVYRVKTPQGDYAPIAFGDPPQSPATEFLDVANTALASATITVGVVAVGTARTPEVHASYRVKGKLISTRNDRTDGYQIVLMAATINLPTGSPDFFPVAYATTEANGYFLTSFLTFDDPADIGRLVAAKSVVSKDDKVWEQPIQLHTVPGTGRAPDKKFIPRRLIIAIGDDLGAPAPEGEDDCGCNDLNFHEKKTLEEYSYYTVVRTTEPAIIADTLEEEDDVDLDEIYGTRTGLRVPFQVFKKYHVALNTQIRSIAVAPVITVAPVDGGATPGSGMIARALNPALGYTFNKDLLDKLTVDAKVADQLKGKKKRQFKGRSYLTPLNQIDWDDEPTIYQAASVAHGHLLHFKQEWRPDGYSIGDLIYSLPLAPGQKKQLAVIDWERRESAANSQSLDYEESLNNTLVRDRDISEVITATLNENIKASSNATTSGFGAAHGGAMMGIFSGGTFGALHGISGGKSSAGSGANQNSHRDSTVNSLQSISDRTTQAASSVRSQRATVVQTVSQGERVGATAESVANYNHCHAITIQYFEVLRHFSVHTRLSDVQECLFVPLHMTSFDLPKCLRWRNTLEAGLTRPGLAKGFDAILRISKEKENSEDYYTSIGFPKTYFAEQPMRALSGALFMEFTFFNTREGKISNDLVSLLQVFGLSIDPAQYNDRYISNSELAEMVGPRAIEFLLNSIVVETDKGSDLRLDLTLLNRFRQNALLQVSLRTRAGTPTTIRRDLVNGIRIRIDKSKLSGENKAALEQFGNKFMKITIRSGHLRYRSDSMSQFLFSGSVANDLFADGDGVYVDTPLNGEELRNPRGEDIDAANRLLQHLNENLEYYHKCIWFNMTPERRYMLLDGIIAPGKANGRSVASVVENRLIGIAGNSLIMPVAPGNQLDPTIDEHFRLFEQYYSEENDPRRVSLPTKGVYAESVIGQCNACEKKDESRFWRWEESPIPDSPNTQILPLDTGTRRFDPGNLQPKDFPQPIVNVQNAPNMPDPTGLQAMLQLMGKGDAFRDVTGLNQNQLNALAAFQKSLDTAQAFGKEAAELAKAAGAMKLVEDGKKAGVVNNDEANKRTGAILDDLQKDPNANRLKQGIELIDQLKKEGKISEPAADAAKASLLKNFQDSSNAKTPMANEEIGKLADKSKETNKDISVTRPGGETVDIKNPTANGSTASGPDTAGVTLDMVGTGGSLKFLPTGETVAVDPTPAQLKIIADNGGWIPTDLSDYANLAVGGRTIGVGSFNVLFNHLRLVPQRSVQTLNLVCHCPDLKTLAFQSEFVFSEQTGVTTFGYDHPQNLPYTEVTYEELVLLNEVDSFQWNNMTIALADVRAAFATDAEVRLFCIGGGANELVARALANLLLVKVLAFIHARIEFRVEVLEGAGIFNRPALSKLIQVTPRFSTDPFLFNNFEQMVTEDPAKTGRLVVLPRRS